MSVDSTYDNNFGRRGAELACHRRVETASLHPLSSRSLPLTLAAIPGRLFSSLLPPSFARGRFATFFFVADGAMVPAPLLSALAAPSLA
jgi:hypothetical protein